MASILKEDNPILVLSEKSLLLEWKFEESDLKCYTEHRTPEFILSDGTASFFRFLVNGTGSLYLENVSKEMKGNYVSMISNANGDIIYRENVSRTSLNKDLLSNFSSSWLSLKTSSLVLKCSIHFENPNLSKEISGYFSNMLLSNRTTELSEDFKKVLEEEENYSDIVLNVDEDRIKAHKMVLRARSSVFNKMFSNDLSETAYNSVDIKDIKSKTMRRLISYLYTGTAEKCGFEETKELYYAADKYEVLSLREDCKTELLKQLCVDNACSLFTLASLHSDQSLKAEVEKFIGKNIKSVVETEGFKGLSKEDTIHLFYLSIRTL